MMEESKDDVNLIQNELEERAEPKEEDDGNTIENENDDVRRKDEENRVGVKDEKEDSGDQIESEDQDTNADITEQRASSEPELDPNLTHEVTFAGVTYQVTMFKDLPEDFKQPILMTVHGQALPSLVPEDKIVLHESKILSGEQPLKSMEELRQICNDLLHKPVLAVVKSVYKRQAADTGFYSRYWRATLDIIIHTDHDAIQSTLKSYLDEAVLLMERGEPFCMKISFSQVLKEILSMSLEPADHKSGKGCKMSLDMYLTNCSKSAWYNPSFICGCCMSRKNSNKKEERQFTGLKAVFVDALGNYDVCP